MDKIRFDKLAEELYSKGYKRYNQHWHHENYVIGKGFHKEDNKWDDERYAYQIGLSIYDYSEMHELWDRLPKSMQNHVGIEIHVDMSRTIGERLDFVLAWHDEDTIENVEKWAEHFYRSMCSLFVEPREEKPDYEGNQE